MLKVKIDTKEIFHVISLNVPDLTANMAEELVQIIAKLQKEDERSLVIDLKNVVKIDPEVFPVFKALHETTYQCRKSLVFCELQAEVKSIMIEGNDPELLNITPTESEAWDIVQMEEIERELDFES
jgi:anti-anti-sigma regulatory factor